MATQLFNNVLSGASKVINNALNNNVTPQKQAVKLSPRQQVDLFLRMPESHLEAIRANRGDVEYNRYVRRMLELSKEVYSAE